MRLSVLDRGMTHDTVGWTNREGIFGVGKDGGSSCYGPWHMMAMCHRQDLCEKDDIIYNVNMIQDNLVSEERLLPKTECELRSRYCKRW